MGIFDWLLYYKCPECNKYKGEEASRNIIGTKKGERYRTLPHLGKGNPKFRRRGRWEDVTVTLYQSEYRCKNCDHVWKITDA